MTKEKKQSLVAYQNQLKNKLEAEVPQKHIKRQKQYKEFLLNELRIVTQTLIKNND